MQDPLETVRAAAGLCKTEELVYELIRENSDGLLVP